MFKKEIDELRILLQTQNTLLANINNFQIEIERGRMTADNTRYQQLCTIIDLLRVIRDTLHKQEEQ